MYQLFLADDVRLSREACSLKKRYVTSPPPPPPKESVKNGDFFVEDKGFVASQR